MYRFKKNVSLLVLFALFLSSSCLYGAPSWICGKITRITSMPTGLMIMINNGVVPDNCQGTLHSWMLIPESNKAMISAAFFAASLHKTDVCAYTEPIVSGEFCRIGQLDIGGF